MHFYFVELYSLGLSVLLVQQHTFRIENFQRFFHFQMKMIENFSIATYGEWQNVMQEGSIQWQI